MRRRKPYADAFKQEAIKLVTEQDMKPSQVARDLGIDGDTLRRWLHEWQAAPAEASTPTTAALVRLRREHEQLRLERDIVKKALGIFARMPQ